MQITSLSEQFGLLLRPGGTALQDVPGDWLRTALASRAGGVMLLRGFGADVDGFVAFTEKLGSGFLVHHNIGNRDYVNGDQSLATVNKDCHAIDFHTEMASSPIKPDMLWLHCVAPARRRGRIGFVDGHKVLSDLSGRTRARLEAHGFRYRYRDLPAALWRPVWGRAVGVLEQERGAMLRQLALHGAAVGVTGVTLNDRDELGFDYVSAPIYTAPLSGLQVFAGGLLDNPGGTLMGDGSPVERSICIDVTQASYQNAVWIAWQAGDIVVVDNTRVMHAREAFDDSARRVLIRYSRAAFAAAPVQR